MEHSLLNHLAACSSKYVNSLIWLGTTLIFFPEGSTFQSHTKQQIRRALDGGVVPMLSVEF